MEKYKGEYESTIKATREQPKAEETEELCSYGFTKFSKKKEKRKEERKGKSRRERSSSELQLDFGIVGGRKKGDKSTFDKSRDVAFSTPTDL